MAKEFDLKINQGADETLKLQLENVDSTRKNLMGYSLEFHFKQTYEDADSDATIIEGIILDPPTNGEVAFVINRDITSAVDAGRYVYDIELYALDSDMEILSTERVMYGILDITPSVIR